MIYKSDLATERERQFTTARAAKIPARNWVDNPVAFCLKCDLARYTTPSCQFLQINHDVQVFHEMSFIQNSQATANKAEYGMKDKKDEL